MTIRQKLEALRDSFISGFPAALTAVNAALNNYQDIIADTPGDPERSQLGFYLDIDKENDTTSDFNIIIQSQLPRINAPDSWDYQQAITNYFKGIDPSLIDATYLNTWDGDNWPPMENSSSIIIFKLNYQTVIDDC